MPTLQDLHTFGPFLLIGLCLLVGKAIKASKVPDWLIPILLPVLGLVSGAATAAALGSDWRAWLEHSLLGLLLGSSAVGVHQAGRALAGKGGSSNSNSPPAPPAPPAAPPAGAQPPAGPPPGSVLMRRVFAPIACAAALLLGGAMLSGCAAAAPVLIASEGVEVVATAAADALQGVKPWVDDYFAAYPDPAAQAKVLRFFQRAVVAAQALAQLAAGVAAADEGQYLAALSDFRNAWADLLDAIRGLPNAEVVTTAPAPTAPKLTVGVASAPKKKVLVTKPVSAFWPKRKVAR